MYTDFFGLNDIPFTIAPNPRYLFMSERHKEALAHLSYGLGETGGFVLLTGEVGTGKTTVSRCLLSQLPENTQAAFILNPTLSSHELLATICDELKVRYRKTGATLKTLTDKIQGKLLKNHLAGINTLLIIDEAQHLKADVLEQLRLLTNLETDTKKLLQVILIGQPELQQLLKRQDLRQLAQRITARYHLLPLNKDEVGYYIQHRLMVAGSNQSLFSKAAIVTIHQLSNGIPRLINLLCDRALLGAFGLHKQQVDKKLVLGASKEALGEEYLPIPWWKKGFVKAGFSFILLLIVASLAFKFGQGERQPEKVIQAKPIEAKQIDQALAESSNDLPASFRYLFTLWRIEVDETIAEPCEMANQYALACYWHKGTLPSLLKLNYPAVFKFYSEKGESFYGTLVNSKNNNFTFIFNGVEQQVNRIWLDKYWQGGAVVFWQPPNIDGQAVDAIGHQSSILQWQWLEHKLSANQQRPQRVVSAFDLTLQNHLQQFQRQHAIVQDSMADKQTLMMLANTVSQGLPVYNR